MFARVISQKNNQHTHKKWNMVELFIIVERFGQVANVLDGYCCFCWYLGNRKLDENEIRHYASWLSWVETHFSELPDLQKIETYTNPTKPSLTRVTEATFSMP